MPTDSQDLTHRSVSASCFNACWRLMEKSDRTADDDAQMMALTYASFYHWMQRPDLSDESRSIGFWQISRCHALLGDGTAALRNARRCLEVSPGLDPFYLAYAHEAMARAYHVLGESALRAEHLQAAEALAIGLPADDHRETLLKDLRSLTPEP